jgi:hypothetical protein
MTLVNIIAMTRLAMPSCRLRESFEGYIDIPIMRLSLLILRAPKLTGEACSPLQSKGGAHNATCCANRAPGVGSQNTITPRRSNAAVIASRACDQTEHEHGRQDGFDH